MKAWFTFLATLLLCVVLLAAPTALAATTQRVFDQADLLTSAQEETLATEIVQFQKDTGMDFVFISSDQAHGEIDQTTIADDYYDKYGFGLDAQRSGALYYIDLYEREHYLSTTGQMINVMTDARINSAINMVGPYLTNGNYAQGVSAILGQLKRYVDTGIPEGQYQYDDKTGEQLTPFYQVITSNELLVNLAIAAAVALLFAFGVSRRYQLKGSTYHYQLQDNCDMNLTNNEDQYLHSTTTQSRKPDYRSGGGGFGGGGFGGGGSGVHIGSSGTSHGGGGGKF